VKSILIDFDTTKGLIFYGNQKTFISEIVPRQGIYNPKIVIFAFIENFSSSNLENIFKEAFDRFKIVKLFIADANLLSDSTSLDIFTFNPFNPGLRKFRFSIETFELDRANFNEFIDDRSKNFHGFPLRVAIFPFFVLCMGETFPNMTMKHDTYRLHDGEALKVLSKFANFTVKLTMSNDGVKHGYEMKNHSFSGVLGMIERDEIDLSANGRIVSEYNTTNNLALFPLSSTKLKFFVPKRNWKDVNIASKMWNFFDRDLKVGIFLMFLLGPVLIFFTNQFSSRSKITFESFLKEYLRIYSILMFVSVKLPKNWPSRFIIGSVVLVWLVIGNTYSGKMIEFLNANLGITDLKSIDELLKSSFKIVIPFPYIVLFEQGNYKTSPASHLLIYEIIKKARVEEAKGKL
jgi:hypothetical protein